MGCNEGDDDMSIPTKKNKIYGLFHLPSSSVGC